MFRMRRAAIAVALGVAVGTGGCAEHFVFRGPPGASIYVNEVKIGTAPVTYKVPRAAPFRYRVGEKDCVSAEGTMETRKSAGRIVGMIFTAGLLATVRGATVFRQDFLDASPCEPPTRQEPAPQAIEVEIDVEEVEFFHQRGTGRIQGQAFAKTRGGDVKPAAGESIFLWPNCTAVEAWVAAPSRTKITNLGNYSKETTGDGSGNFEFEGLAPGRYHLHTLVSWEAPGRYGTGLQVVPLDADVTVTDGQTTKAILYK